MKIRFQVDADRLTLNDLIAIEDESQSPKFMRDFLAKFCVNDEGEYLEPGEAQAIVGNLTLTELMDTVNSFSDSVKGLQEALIPKVTD